MPFHYGDSTNDYVEIPELDATGQPTGQMRRPPSGYTVWVRDPDTGTRLPDTATKPYGELDFTVDPPIVQVSADLGGRWKTLFGTEALGQAVAVGQAGLGEQQDFNTLLAGYAKADSPKFTGTVYVNEDPVPDNPVGANMPGVTLRFPPLADPNSPPVVDIVPGEKVLTLPVTAPTSTQVPVVNTDLSQSYVALADLGSAGAPAGGSSVQSTARAILAAAAASKPSDWKAVHPSPPTVTLVAGTTSSITGAIRVPFKRLNASTVDTTKDPHYYYRGARPGQVAVHTTERGYANFLTGGNSQNRRDYWQPISVFSGQVMEWFIQPTTTTLRYRVWVDGMPLTNDLVAATTTTSGTALTAGSNYLLRLDFGSDPGPRIVMLEVNDPRIGGCWIGPTDTLTRYTPRLRTLLGFGDSHTAAGANGVNIGNSWLPQAARHLGMNPVNMAIGGSGFLVTAGGGTVAPNFRSRIDPDIVPMAPDLITFWGGYNDVGTASTATQIRDEAAACFTQLRTKLPSAVLVSIGPWQQTQNIAASTKAIDDAMRQAADTVGIPHISLVDPEGFLRDTTIPAWAAGTAYGIGDVVTQGNVAWKARSAHTAGTTFATDQPTKWRALSFNTGTGKVGATTGDGNADINVGADGIHASLQGHTNVALFLVQQLNRVLRDLAA